jgi:hypothetical protein
VENRRSGLREFLQVELAASLARSLVEGPTYKFDHSGLADTPCAGHAYGYGTTFGLDNDLSNRVGDAGEIQKIPIGLIVRPHLNPVPQK